MVNMFENIMKEVQERHPLVHCITNYVTVNDCANALLAVQGSPIMADDEAEVEDITSLCNALVINIGTLNSRTIESMMKAGKKANALGHPVILDPVGAGASTLRSETTFALLKEIKFSVIRGNISKIKTVSLGSGTTRGVDADVADMITEENIEDSIAFAKQLSQRTGAIIAITGAIDIVANSEKAYVIYNGHKEMSRITGTGCMLSAILGAYVVGHEDCMVDAVACAVTLMGYCGEIAYKRVEEEQKGSGSMHMYILDALSTMSEEALRGGQNVEVR